MRGPPAAPADAMVSRSTKSLSVCRKSALAASASGALTPDLLERPGGLGGQGTARQTTGAGCQARRSGCQHCRGHVANASCWSVRCEASGAAHNLS